MSFDKSKYMRNAERYLAQGKIQAAIGEYRQIIENDTNDFSTLNMLGDLCVKVQDMQEAIKCYTQVAEHYSNQGFAQKAIAIYTKISRLNPDSIEISAKLAQLYQLRGSIAEARSHYAVVAEHYQKKGKKTEALAVWKQIAELDAGNTEIYLKIAEICRQEKQIEEAAGAYIEAGNRLLNKKQFETAVEVFSKALEMTPNNLIALNGLVKAQIGLGYADEAARTLENLLEQQPYNREILNLLINCHLDLNNPAEAEKAVIKLVEQEPANYPRFLDVTQGYLKIDDLASAARILAMTSEHLLVSGQAEELGKWLIEILAKNPEQLDALRLLVRFHAWQRDEAELKESLIRLAESAQLNESVEDEHYALSQLVLISPHEVGFARRLQEIKQQRGEMETVVTSADLVQIVNPAESTEIPTYESFAEAENVSVSHEAAQSFMEDYVNFNAGESFQANTFDYESLSQNGAISDFALERNGHNANGSDFASAAAGNEQAQTNAFYFETTENKAENSSANSTKKTNSLSGAYDEEALQEELETIEYYHAQGYIELALKNLNALADNYGELPEIAKLREEIGEIEPQNNSENQAEEEKTFEFATVAQFLTENPEVSAVTVQTTADSGPLDHKGFDILNEFRDELGFDDIDAPTKSGDYDTYYQLGIAYQEMGLMEEAIREYQEAVRLVTPTDGTLRFFYCCNLLGHCFMERKMPHIALMWYLRAQETEGLGDAELKGLRYEIANAYEAEGDTVKAFQIFEQIYAVDVEYRDVSRRLSQLQALQT